MLYHNKHYATVFILQAGCPEGLLIINQTSHSAYSVILAGMDCVSRNDRYGSIKTD